MSRWSQAARLAEAAGALGSRLPTSFKWWLATSYDWPKLPDRWNVLVYILFNAMLVSEQRDYWIKRRSFRCGHNILPFSMRLNLKNYVDRRYYFLNEDLGLAHFLLDNLKAEDIFLDVGANTGHTALMASTLGKQVYAFEPEEAAYRKLIENAAINKAKNITTFNLALSNRSGEGKLAICTNNDGSHSMDKEFQSAIGNSYGPISVVKRERLDLLGLPQPAVVKIDVEGHEMAVLKGMGYYLTGSKYLLIETLSERMGSLVDYLKQYSFDRFYFLNAHHRFIPLTEMKWSDKKRLFDILAVNAGAPAPKLY